MFVSDAVASPRTLVRHRKALGLVEPCKRYFINEAFFFEWSHSLAWLLGLIWTDGSLTGQSIGITSKDKDLLDTVALLISHNVGPVPRMQGKYWNINFSSRIVADHLRSFGLHRTKSFTIAWPINMPSEYDAAFVRGCLDGDGYVSLTQSRRGQQVADLTVGWCGASPLRDGLRTWLQSHQLRYCHVQKRTTVWAVNITHQASLRKLYHLLYPDDSVPRLRRKYVNFHRWLITPRAPRHSFRLRHISEADSIPLFPLRSCVDGKLSKGFADLPSQRPNAGVS
jgi:hypothetical protein